eukprot:8503796-Lingulodinium_polyedra.AAC.1
MLLYRTDGGWHDRSMEHVVARARSLMPEGLRGGWALLNRGEARGQRANDCADVRCGPDLGLRPPILG